VRGTVALINGQRHAMTADLSRFGRWTRAGQRISLELPIRGEMIAKIAVLARPSRVIRCCTATWALGSSAQS